MIVRHNFAHIAPPRAVRQSSGYGAYQNNKSEWTMKNNQTERAKAERELCLKCTEKKCKGDCRALQDLQKQYIGAAKGEGKTMEFADVKAKYTYFWGRKKAHAGEKAIAVKYRGWVAKDETTGREYGALLDGKGGAAKWELYELTTGLICSGYVVGNPKTAQEIPRFIYTQRKVLEEIFTKNIDAIKKAASIFAQAVAAAKKQKETGEKE